ncbi:unnamed protein product [Alopecurus aequalis]
MAAKQDEAVASICRKKNMDLEGVPWRVPVYRTRYGNYQARIWEPRWQTMTYLGSFGTAVEAARAHGAAAVRLHLHGAARDFRQRTAATDDDADAPLLRGQGRHGRLVLRPGCGSDGGRQEEKKGGMAGSLDRVPRRELETQRPQQSGRYNARIWDPTRQARLWLGTFDKAEDATGAYDAEAVRLHGERTITNFEQLLVDLNDVLLELPPPDFASDSVIPGAQLDDVWTDLPRAELQPVDELLQDMDFTDVGA